jgi:outer membrane protein assembly factor BamB
MNRNTVFVILLGGLLITSTPTIQAENWPGWRGPRSDGSCVEKDVATDWDPARARWKIALPGQGHASPIVWGNRVCTVTGLTESKERVLLCLDRMSGEILWQETVVQGPLQKLHKENSYELGESCYASPAISNGQVFVRGFQQLFCFGPNQAN